MIFEKQIEGIYKKQFMNRCDDTESVFYFSVDDFEGLHREPYAFQSSSGDRLQGYFYYYENYVPDRLIVFDHGFGGGHTAYMKEIEMLCKHGFRVFSYDHTGCMESEGDSPRGLAQSLCDLNDCFNTFKADEKYRDLDFSVVGHSWGGFSTMNIAALHPEISHVVSMSGFVAVEQMINQFFGGIMKPYRKNIIRIETENNAKFMKYHAVDSLTNTNAKVLLIYSSNDKMVNKEMHYDVLKNGLAHKENVKIMLVDNKGHNPNYTEDAAAYLNEFLDAKAKKVKKKELETKEQKQEFLNSYDWNRMTAQDESVWNEIFKVLDEV